MRKRSGALRRQKREQGRRAASGAACRFQPKVRARARRQRSLSRLMTECQLNVDYEDLEGQRLLLFYEGE